MAKDKKEKESHKILNTFIILILIIVCIFLYARYLGTTGVITKEYRIASKTIPTNFSGIKIIQLSDIHYGSTTYDKDMKLIVKKINELKPDLVFFTGDLLDPNIKLEEKDIVNISTHLNNIDASLGKYRILGNEDYKNKYYDEIMNKTDFILLENNYELIYNEGLTPIYLGGTASSIKSTLDLNSTFKYYKNIKDKPYVPKYKIILTHEGDNADEIVSYDSSTNLILSGHSHNGQVVIPYYGGIFIPNGAKKYNGPHYKINKTDLYVSSGIGTTTLRYRLFNKPSFSLYRLKSL